MKSDVTTMSHTEWLLLMLLSIVWGGSFFFVGVAVEAFPPLTIVTMRVSLAAVALLFVVYLTGLRMVFNPVICAAFVIMGILNNVIPFTLIAWGQTQIASGLASILNATTPMFTIVAAHFFTEDEKMTSQKVIGITIGFAGVIIMLGYEVLSGLGDSLLPQFAVLGAAICYAFAGIFGRRFAQSGVKPVVTATGQVTTSSLILIPLALLYDKPFTLPMPGFEVWLAILGLALVSTAFAYILYFRLLSTAGATNILLVTLLIPVSAILLGITALGEQLETKQILGMGLISMGLLAIDGRLVKLAMRKLGSNRQINLPR